MTQPGRPPLAISVPDECEAGVYANLVSVSHTNTDFTLDFLVSIPGVAHIQLAGGGTAAGLKYRVVSRVKLPPPQIWELMRALEFQLSRYEAEQHSKGDGGGHTGDTDPSSPG